MAKRTAMSNESRPPDADALAALAEPQPDTVADTPPHAGQDNPRPLSQKKSKQQFRREKRDVHGWLVSTSRSA